MNTSSKIGYRIIQASKFGCISWQRHDVGTSIDVKIVEKYIANFVTSQRLAQNLINLINAETYRNNTII